MQLQAWRTARTHLPTVPNTVLILVLYKVVALEGSLKFSIWCSICVRYGPVYMRSYPRITTSELTLMDSNSSRREAIDEKTTPGEIRGTLLTFVLCCCKLFCKAVGSGAVSSLFLCSSVPLKASDPPPTDTFFICVNIIITVILCLCVHLKNKQKTTE